VAYHQVLLFSLRKTEVIALALEEKSEGLQLEILYGQAGKLGSPKV